MPETDDIDDIEVAIPDEEADEEVSLESSPPAQSVTEDDLEGLKASVEEHKANTAREKAAREAAEARAEEATTKVASSDGERIQAQNAALANAIAHVSGERARIEAALAQAQTDGDYAEAARQQGFLNEAIFDQRDYVAQKRQLDAYVEQAKTAPRPAPVQQKPAAPQFSNETQAWFNKHPEVLSDRQKMALAQAAHFKAVANGYAVDSPQYFKSVDQEMGYAEPEARTQEPARQQRTSMAISPTRNTPTGTNPTRGSVRLTAEERSVALGMFPAIKDPQEKLVAYAKSKRSLESESRR